MPGISTAFEKWQVERCAALDSLEDVYGKVTGKQRGRQRATQHLNRALFVALSAERTEGGSPPGDSLSGTILALRQSGAILLDDLGAYTSPKIPNN
jgi:hypothetical protein